MSEQEKISSIAVCIPTASRESHCTIGHTLQSIAIQTYRDITVYVRDEGKAEIFRHRSVRQMWDLLSIKGIRTVYKRTRNRMGVANARWELYSGVGREKYILCLDDDMVLDADTIMKLVQFIEEREEVGFVQGVKYDIDEGYYYWNDINLMNGDVLNSHSAVMQPKRIWFGDTALLLMRRNAFVECVDPNILLRFSVDGLTGEDIALSLMIANKYEGWGIPSAIGSHLSPERPRWKWEPPSDLLQIETLRKVVRPEVLKAALPHLAEYV